MTDVQRSRLRWRKSTASQGASNCVELAPTTGGDVAVRNSHNPTGPILVFTRRELAAFLQGAKQREFDDLT